MTEEVNIPYEFHKFIIGAKGKDVRKLMQDFDVNISIPSQDEHSDLIKVRGPPANVRRASEALKERLNILEQEREDRVSWACFLYSFHNVSFTSTIVLYSKHKV